MKDLPSQEFLREYFYYNPETGVFTWIKRPRPDGPRLVGSIAGTRQRKGYITIKPGDGGTYSAHRLAWVWMYGSLSNEVYIDHIDGNTSNNSINNLRLASAVQNQQNKKRMPHSKAGLKGASYQKRQGSLRKWRSTIMVNGCRKFIGYYATAEEAHAAYCVEARRHFGEFARTE